MVLRNLLAIYHSDYEVGRLPSPQKRRKIIMGRPPGSKNKSKSTKSKPTKAKREKKAKTAPTASQGNVTTNHNGPGDDAIRALFLQHRGPWNSFKAKLKAVQELGKDVKAALKADGFLVKEFEVADDLATVKGEAKVTGDVTLRLRVARWIGHPMGAQLDLFAQPNKPTLSVVDQARDDGKRAAMEHETPKPPHAPETEAYKAWMEAYHEEQGRQVRALIKPPDGANGAAAADEKFDNGEPSGLGESRLPAAAQGETEL
jgi:hypothetical protein